MYTLTLTREDRKAIDWIGGRYAHGDELADVLMDAESLGAEDWDCVGDITFKLGEAAAWEVKEIVERDALACFSHKLSMKLMALCDKIV